MRLQRLRLQNFRQHVDNTIEFRRGLTGIIGPNGAGKSTILEAIAWAIYGAAAARGTNDTIRFSRAAPRARVVVDLTFELETHEYRVTRTLSSADVYLDNSVNPVASGVGTVTSYLQSRLGMTRQEFFNTYFTGQKELQFLAQMGPTDRGRFLAQVLGYERLRKAQELARDRRRELAAEIDGLKSGLPDPEVLRSERTAGEQRVKLARKTAAQTEKARDKLQKELADLTPAWNTMQEARARARELAQQLEAIEREIAGAAAEVERAEAELQKIATAEAELSALKPQLAELAEVTSQCEALEEQARLHERRVATEERVRELTADVTSIRARLDQIGRAPELLKQTTEEIEQSRGALEQADAEVETLRSTWNRDAQDVKTQLRLSGGTDQELQAQIKRLRATGKHGPCPVCTRRLDDEFDTVLAHLDDELEKLRQNVRWLQAREKQLATKPAELSAAEERLAGLRDAMDKKKERLAHCETATGELWERTGELRSKQRQLTLAEEDLARIPSSYERARHDVLKARLAELRAIAQQASVLEHAVTQRAARSEEVAAARARHADAAKRHKVAGAAQKQLKFDEQKFLALKEKYEKLSKEADSARVSAAESAQVLLAAEEALFTARRAETAFEEKRVRLVGLESELKHYHEMDGALAELRSELVARVRPELADLASTFLTDLTDGRYNALDIDESYNVIVLEDGEEKPVISGGEEDVANLVLRIAISQMIAERAGQQLSTLFLDEVFAALDLERRENVIELLQKLHDRFEQVVLITHIEAVREGLDHVIRLEYDERTGASVIREDVMADEYESVRA